MNLLIDCIKNHFNFTIFSLFISDRKMEQEMDRQFRAASVVMHALHRRVVVKRELNRKSKLSSYWSVLILTYGHQLWVVTERTRSWIQIK